MELLVLARLLLLQLLLLVLVSGQDDMGDMDMESMMPAPGQETGPMGAAKKVRHLPTCLVIVIVISKRALTWKMSNNMYSQHFSQKCINCDKNKLATIGWKLMFFSADFL